MILSVKIRHIFISPGHNFCGRKDLPPREHPTIEMQEVECVAGQGIRGDRFFGYRADYKGQITFFSQEIYEALCREFSVNEKPPSVFRRNVITEGVDLNTLVGKEFEIQGVRFRGMAECSPCHWMNYAFAEGAERFLHARGGLRAKVLTDGMLRVDAA